MPDADLLPDDPDLRPAAPSFDVDAVVVGGGPAGLSAALTLGRAGRPTVLFDAGEGRNRRAPAAQGFLTQDGVPPETLRETGRREVEAYGVEVRSLRVEEARRLPGGFCLTLPDGDQLSCRVLVLATGVVDDLPDVPGLDEAWGRTAIHCPYCHGHEFAGRAAAVLGRGDATYGMARLLLGWTDRVTIVTNGEDHLSDDERRRLAAAGIPVETAPIARLRQSDGVVEAVELADGREVPCGVFYLQPPQRMGSPLAEALGVEVADGRYAADADGRTSVPGLFVAGDVLNRAQQVATAVAGGAWAGIAANHDLLLGAPERVRESVPLP